MLLLLFFVSVVITGGDRDNNKQHLIDNTYKMKQYVSYNTKYLKQGLDIIDMIILTEIENLYKKYPDNCHPSDDYIGRLVLLKRQAVNNRIKNLAKKGYFEIITINKQSGAFRTFIFNSQYNPDNIGKIKFNTSQYNPDNIGKIKFNTSQYNPDNITGSDNNKLYNKDARPENNKNEHPFEDGKNPNRDFSQSSKMEASNTGPENIEKKELPNENKYTGPFIEEKKELQNVNYPGAPDAGPINTGPENTSPKIIEKNINKMKKEYYTPDFLKKINFNGNEIEPFNLQMISGQLSISERNYYVELGKEYIKIIINEMKRQDKNYLQNKKYIIDNSSLEKHRDKLILLDMEYFMNYLKEISAEIPDEEKKKLRPKVLEIRHYINYVKDIPIYENAIKNIRLAYGIK